VLQLVRISHHIDRCDLSVFDFKRRCLEFTIGFQRDETGQSVDESCTNESRSEEQRLQLLIQLHDGIEPQDWLRGRTKGKLPKIPFEEPAWRSLSLYYQFNEPTIHIAVVAVDSLLGINPDRCRSFRVLSRRRRPLPLRIH
jgi:hypothetical protein